MCKGIVEDSGSVEMNWAAEEAANGASDEIALDLYFACV